MHSSFAYGINYHKKLHVKSSMTQE